MFISDLFDDKIKGADGKACWPGYRYAGTNNNKDKCIKVNENSSYEAVQSAILRRIMHQHPDILRQYGPDVCMDAAEQVAQEVGDVDEIGTSDVSAYVKRTIELCRDASGGT